MEEKKLKELKYTIEEIKEKLGIEGKIVGVDATFDDEDIATVLITIEEE